MDPIEPPNPLRRPWAGLWQDDWSWLRKTMQKLVASVGRAAAGPQPTAEELIREAADAQSGGEGMRAWLAERKAELEAWEKFVRAAEFDLEGKIKALESAWEKVEGDIEGVVSGLRVLDEVGREEMGVKGVPPSQAAVVEMQAQVVEVQARLSRLLRHERKAKVERAWLAKMWIWLREVSLPALQSRCRDSALEPEVAALRMRLARLDRHWAGFQDESALAGPGGLESKLMRSVAGELKGLKARLRIRYKMRRDLDRGEWERELEPLRQSADELGRRLHDVQEDHDALLRETDGLLKSLEEERAKAKTAEWKLGDANALSQALEADLFEARAKAGRREAELAGESERLKAKLEDVLGKLAKEEDRVRLWERACDELREDARSSKEARARASELAGEIERLKIEAGESLGRLDAAQEGARLWEHRCGDLLEERRADKDALARAQALAGEIEKLKIEAGESSGKLDAAQESLRLWERRCDEMREQARSDRGRLEKISGEGEQLKAEFGDALKNLAAAQEQAASRERLLRELRQERQSEQDQARQQSQDLLRQVEDSGRRLEAVREEGLGREAELRHELERLKADAGESLRKLAAAQENAAQWERRCGDLLEERRRGQAKAEEQLDVLRRQVEDSGRRLEAVREEGLGREAELRHELERLKAEADESLRKLAAAQESAAQWERRCGEMAEERRAAQARAEEQLEAMRREVEDSGRRLEAVREEGQGREVELRHELEGLKVSLEAAAGKLLDAALSPPPLATKGPGSPRDPLMRRALGSIQAGLAEAAKACAAGRPEAVSASIGRIQDLVRTVVLLESPPLNTAPASVLPALETTLNAWEPALRKRRIRLARRFRQPLPSCVAAQDAASVAFYQVLKNAYEAMPGGGVLTVEAGLESASGKVLVSVRDTGPGLPMVDSEELFAPGTSAREGRLGLGLALARRLMAGMGGELQACNPEGGGALLVFRFSVP